MMASSHASSRALEALLAGPRIVGVALGERHLWFSGYVVSLTAPGGPRMPNGIECDLTARPEQRVAIGNRSLVVGDTVVEPGPGWNPVPAVPRGAAMPPGPEPMVGALAGLGPGLTPAGDDVIAGYVAGLVLLHGRRERAHRIALDAAGRTNALSATLLRHAAEGEVPEPVHALLLTGDPASLLRFGRTSGPSWLRGLISAGFVMEALTLR